MLCGLLAVLQAAFVDSVLLYPFSLLQDLVAASELDVSGFQILKALVITIVVVMIDKAANLAFQITG